MTAINTLVFSESTPAQLELCLQSLKRSLLGDHESVASNTFVFYQAASKRLYRQYACLKRQFPGIQWMQVSCFRAELLYVLERSEYVVLLQDTTVFSHPWSLSRVVAMQRTRAHLDVGFSLRIGHPSTYCCSLQREQQPPLFESIGCGQQTFEWEHADADFGYPLEVSASIYRSELLLNLLSDSPHFSRAVDLEQCLNSKRTSVAAGFPYLSCFEQPVAFVNQPTEASVPAQRDWVRESFLQGFDDGLSMDAQPFWGTVVDSARVCIPYSWIKASRVDCTPAPLDPNAALPVLSVVIPCFNYGAYVREAVQSIRNQSLQGVEIIVVDGGSDDPSTQAVISELSKQRGLSVYVRSERHMVGSNRNYGIARARAPFVCCLDADDVLLPTYLEKALFRLVNEEYDVVGAGAIDFGESDGVRGVEPIVRNEQILASNAVMSASVFRKSLWESVGGYRDFGLGADYIYEDWHFWCKCALAGARFLNLSRDYLIGYRVHGSGSLSQQQGLVQSDAEQRAFIENTLVGEQFTYTRSAADGSSVEEVDARVLSAHQQLSFPGKSAPIILLLGSYSPERAHAIVGFASTHFSASQEVIVLLAEEGEPVEVPDYSGLLPHWTVFALERFLGSFDQKLDFVQYLIRCWEVRDIHCVGTDLYVPLLRLVNERFPEVGVVDHTSALPSFSIRRNEASFLVDSKCAVDVELKTFRLSNLEQSNPDSEASEIWILDILDNRMKSLLVPELAVLLPDGWRIMSSEGSPKGFVICSEVAGYFDIKLPKDSQLRLLQHVYGGCLRVECFESSRGRVFDLYAESPDIRSFCLSDL